MDSVDGECVSLVFAMAKSGEMETIEVTLTNMKPVDLEGAFVDLHFGGVLLTGCQ